MLQTNHLTSRLRRDLHSATAKSCPHQKPNAKQTNKTSIFRSGNITYGGVLSEKETKKHRRSLYIVKDMKKDDKFTEDNLKSIRPGNGLHTKHYWNILGKECNQDIEFGTPMKLEFVKNL